MGREFIRDEVSMNDLIKYTVLDPEALEELIQQNQERQEEEAEQVHTDLNAILKPIERLINLTEESETKERLIIDF